MLVHAVQSSGETCTAIKYSTALPSMINADFQQYLLLYEQNQEARYQQKNSLVKHPEV